MKQIKLLVEIVLISGMGFLPMHKELGHNVWYDVDQCILRPQKYFVGTEIAGHLCLLQVDRSILMVQGWVMSLLIRFFGYPDSSSLIHLGHQLNMGS